MMTEKNHRELSVVSQCELLSVSRSGLYYEPVKESEENLCIMRWLDEQYLRTPFYGVERLLILLVLAGYQINRKRLRRLMRLQAGKRSVLYPVPPELTPRSTSIPTC
jgi:putative transposase